MTTENTRYDYDNKNSHFGGIIYASDFDTIHIGSRNIAKRIASDLEFDKQCQRNEEERNRKIKWRETDEETTLYKNK